ncbi:alpha/beta hydrolase [Gloeocapsa sp. PCC 73106]|uniref:alpha/beta hydrolase n=1 Tax=Gloeocapsa sp. PCC 73106 TaxID=102232 RepID=UPI0002AD1199|nr:alpha/beta hydrolase [Gloeocapsa sp. PCC 73106]ELR97469.1 prolyl oligopeptidase family protein [Gloeocapsa sp. PCC 73106]
MKLSKVKTKIWQVSKVLILLYLLLAFALRIAQTRLLFFPSAEVALTPLAVNLPYENVEIVMGESKLSAWWIPAKQPEGPTLLYLHGNGSNLGDLLDEALIFYNLGISTLLIDYRGYGESQGPFPNEVRVYEDAEAAWRYLTTQRQIKSESIFVYGHSLGGAIALELASKHPEIAGVIVEGSFTSIAEMIDHLFPVQIFPKSLILTQKFDSLSKISNITVPILIIHGTNDSVVPYFMSQRLFAAASGAKFLVLIEGAGHNNVIQEYTEKYTQAVVNFIKKLGSCATLFLYINIKKT